MYITDDYQLKFDSLNVTLMQRSEKMEGKGKDAKGTGEYTWSNKGYFPNIERAIDHILKLEIHQNTASDLKELKQLIEDTRDLLVVSIDEAGIHHKGAYALAVAEGKLKAEGDQGDE